jgi:hypothetical protein
MVELFKFVCLSTEPQKWANFFFVVTGSGMAMAWRSFNSASSQGLPLSSEMDSIKIESNSSVAVKQFVYNKFVSLHPCHGPLPYFMNPASISWYCLIFSSATNMQKMATLQRKFLEEVCEDIVPLLKKFTEIDLKTMFQLVHNVCSVEPRTFFMTTKSFFKLFLKSYPTSFESNRANNLSLP